MMTDNVSYAKRKQHFNIQVQENQTSESQHPGLIVLPNHNFKYRSLRSYCVIERGLNTDDMSHNFYHKHKKNKEIDNKSLEFTRNINFQVVYILFLEQHYPFFFDLLVLICKTVVDKSSHIGTNKKYGIMDQHVELIQGQEITKQI